MHWITAIKVSPEGAAVWLRGDYPILRYSKDLAYIASRDGFKIIKRLRKTEIERLPEYGWIPLEYEMK